MNAAQDHQKKLYYNFTETNIIQAIYESISKFSHMVPISFHADTDNMTVFIDEIKIIQALEYILDNAIKYSKNKLIDIEIEKTQKIL